jgi:hypothetical protein
MINPIINILIEVKNMFITDKFAVIICGFRLFRKMIYPITNILMKVKNKFIISKFVCEYDLLI